MNLPKSFDLDFLFSLENEDALYNSVSSQFNDLTEGFYAKANLRLLQHLNLSDHSRVIDLACGTGKLAIEIAKRVPHGKVVGVDLSSQMLAQARLDASQSGLSQIEFLERNIHDVLPEFREGDFDIAITCFSLSYLGCDFILDEFYKLVGPKGQIGITTSSLNSLTEWQPLFLEFLAEHGEMATLFQVHEMPNVPFHTEDFKERMQRTGFKKVQVESLSIPLRFETSQQAASFLITSGWASNYFFRVKDLKMRREILDWALNKLDTLPHLNTSIEFLVGWNEKES